MPIELVALRVAALYPGTFFYKASYSSSDFSLSVGLFVNYLKKREHYIISTCFQWLRPYFSFIK